MTSAVSPNPAVERVVRHPEYYITGGDVVFRVENTLFRCHRYFFTRDSAFFREKLPHPPPPGEFTKGSSDPNPFILEDTLRVDFERLLWVFYNPRYNIYEGSVEEWSSILKLAHQWDFDEVKAFALRELEQHEIPALQKILLYHAHDIDRNLLQAAYAALTARDEPISLEEGQLLGLETALQLARAREIARAPVFSGNRKSGNPRSPVTLAGVELDVLIKDLFQLSTSGPTTERPPTPHTPTRGGTPTGRNTPLISVQTNGAGSPASNLHRGGSVPTGPTATQMEPPTVMAVAAAASKAAPIPPSGSRSTQDTGAVQRAREGAGGVAGGPSGPEPKGKEAAAAEASLDSVMHLDISKRDSSMKKVVSDGHRSERVVSQARADVVESKATTEAQGAPSTSKSASNNKKGQGPTRKSEAAEQGSGTMRPERTRAQSEQAAATTSAQETRSERSRSRTAEPTKKEQLQINTTVPSSEHPRRDNSPTPTRESSPFSFDEHTHRPVQHKKQSSSTTPATTSGLFGFVSNLIGGGGDPGYESSSRESEDDTPMAGGWHPKSRREKAEAEARAKAQQATRLRLDAEAKERAEAEEKARQEVENARLEAEENARLEAEENARLEAEENARLEAEKARKDEEERARLEAEKSRKDAEERTRREAEKARKNEEKRARLEAEKARKDAEERTRLEAEKARKDEEEKARLEAEKARKDAEEKARLAAEEKTRKDAEKALTKKAKKAAAAAAKKREEDAKAEADAKAKAAEAEAKRQAEAEAEKMKREAEAKAAKEKLEAEAKAEEARIKAKEDAENKVKAEEEAEAKEAADREAEAKAAEEAEAEATADPDPDPDAVEEAKPIPDAEAEAKAAKAIADAEAKAAAEKAEQEQEAATRAAKAEAAAAEEAKKEKERKRVEKLRVAELRAKEAEEQVAKQRAADRAARLASSSPASSPISSRSSGGGWFSKVSQAVVSAIVPPGQPDDPRSPSRPAATGSTDLFSRRQIKNLPPANAELGPRNPSVVRQSTSNPFRDPLSSPSATSGTAARSSVSVLSSGTTLVSEEVSTTKNKQEDGEGEGEGTQARTAPETPAPSAEQAGGNEAETQPAEAIADKPSTPDVVEPTQTSDDAAQSAGPDAFAEQSTSSGPILSEADNTQAPESTPPNAAADTEAHDAPKAPPTPPTDSSVPPTIPTKDAAVVNISSPASQETSTSSLQTTDPDNAGETVAPPPEEDAVAAVKSDTPSPEAVAKDPAAQSGTDDSHATGEACEGSTPPQGEDAKSEKPPKLTLPMDRVRQLSTATEMSSSSVETPADEAGSPAIGVEEEGGAGEPGTPSKAKRKKGKSKKKKGEKNSPHPASGATVNDVDNPIEQDIKPVTSDPVDVPGGEGDGVLVDKADSSGEDSAVFVDAPLAETEVEKAADASTSGSDEWNDWADEREVLHN